MNQAQDDPPATGDSCPGNVLPCCLGQNLVQAEDLGVEVPGNGIWETSDESLWPKLQIYGATTDGSDQVLAEIFHSYRLRTFEPCGSMKGQLLVKTFEEPKNVTSGANRGLPVCFRSNDHELITSVWYGLYRSSFLEESNRQHVSCWVHRSRPRFHDCVI